MARRTWILGPAILLAWASLSPASPPEVYSLDPDLGPPGTEVTIKGRGFKSVQAVLFVGPTVAKKAAFKTKSDTELVVRAPEFLTPGTATTVAVIASGGATITAPPSVLDVSVPNPQGSANAKYAHVLRNGVLNRAGGVTLVEPGGAVKNGGAAPLHMVKRGGFLESYERAGGFVIEEPGALFGEKFYSFRNRDGSILHFPVPRITISPGVDPFLYESPVQANLDCKSLPNIDRIEPYWGQAGAVVTLQGSGFGGTSSVVFLSADGQAPEKAGFRVVSDTRLRVEVPPQTGARRSLALIAVFNEKGAGITIPKNGFNPVPKGYRTPTFETASRMRRGLGSSPDFLIVPKGAMAVGSRSVLFVQSGGVIAETSPRVVFAEEGVELPSAIERKGAGKVFVSPRIRLCQVQPLFAPYLD